MNYTDDSYATMLLTLALSPDREEYARPLSVQELRQLEARVRGSELKSLGRLLDVDISGMMIYLGISEEEAYRAYTLLHRSVQLSYAIEGFIRQGIDVVTCCDEDYPQRIRRRLGEAAPPVFYRCGSGELLRRPTVALLGVGGIRTGAEVRAAIDRIVAAATERGYAVVTGGEPGVCRYAEGQVAALGGALLGVLGGGLLERMHADGVAELIASGRGTLLSQEHPEAMFTASHAAARSRALFALSDAAFVFNTDGRHGEAEALQTRSCEWIYAWSGGEGCRALIARGAIPLNDLEGIDFDAMSRHWSSSGAEQLNMFDLL